MGVSALERWHRVVATGSESALAEVLADAVVFHSPIVHSPQVGKAIVTAYLAAALKVLGTPSFRYVREVIGERDAVLEFIVEVDGLHVNGVDMIRWDDDGRIVDFKVMIRPLKAIDLIHRKMAAALARDGHER